MARTELTDFLRRVHAAHAEAAVRGAPVDEVYEEHRARRLTRTAFLAGAAGAGVTLLAACASKQVPSVVASAAAPKVLIVGGGLAGVTCAYRLWQAGVPFTLCDANSAFGGRTWTLRKFFDQGQTVEHGGEFISSEHTALRNLARELGLPLENLRAAQPKDTDEIYWVRGEKYTVPEVLRDYAKVYPALQAAYKAAGYPTLYNHFTAAGRALDHMSVRQWIETNVPGGMQSKLGRLLDVVATTENGGESSMQSSLELIYMLGYIASQTSHDMFYLVGTDEKFRVTGGNDQVVGRMAQRIPAASLRPNTALSALRKRSDGSYAVTLTSQLHSLELVADHVVLALPFATLRAVNLSGAGFAPLKMTAISQLPLGTSTKLQLQFKDRMWYKLGYNGFTYSDSGYQQTWETSRAQSGTAGLLTNYLGGDTGASFNAPSFGPAAPEFSRKFLAGLEQLYPGVTKEWNGKAFLDNWTHDPWHHGSYSYGAVGMYTRFVGIEGVRQGNVHFCGEHASINFAGFMNGAVETGEAVALEILRDMHLPSAQATKTAS